MTENKEITQNATPCDLCGLDVFVAGFKLETQQGQKVFCCEGCKAIYKMLNDSIVLPNQD
jgi:hypothetical protein